MNCPHCDKEQSKLSSPLPECNGYLSCWHCKKIFGYFQEVEMKVQTWKLTKEQVEG